MRVPYLLMLGVVAAAVGCSGQKSTNGQANASAGSAASGGGDIRQLAECSAKMDAVGRLFGAIGAQASGSQAAEMSQLSYERGRAGMRLRQKAEELERSSGAAAGQGETQVARIIRETEASLNSEQEKRPFEDFGTWLGSEADRCAPLVPPET